MAENSIEMVREAEKKADETIRAAALESARIVEEAQGEALRLAQQAEDDARDKAAQRVAAAHIASQKELTDAVVQLGSEMEALRAKARERQPQAVKMILDSLARD